MTIPTWEFFRDNYLGARHEVYPEVVNYFGREVPTRALIYERLSVEDMKKMRVFNLTHGSVARPEPEIVFLSDFQIFFGSGPSYGVSFCVQGRSFNWGSHKGDRYTNPQLFRSYVQRWNHIVYAGRHMFKEESLSAPYDDYVVGDITVRMTSVQEDPTGYECNSFLADLYPLPHLEASFVSEKMYETCEYSLFSEVYHGPMADQIGEQWLGPMVVPCDGAGLFARRFGDRATCSDIMQGSWVHKSVKFGSLSEALRDSPEGFLQVLMYCTSFLTEEDYKYIRPPYIIVDRYRPAIVSPYQTDLISSSQFFDITSLEPRRDHNPPFSKNLVLRGEATFYSDHISSQYARSVGLPYRGEHVTQTWKEWLAHPDDYSTMVGMIPLLEHFDSAKRLYTRIIYWTSGERPAHVPYVVSGLRSYFYFSQSGIIEYPNLAQVHDFPGVKGLDFVGLTESDLRFEYPQLYERIVNLLRSQFIRSVKGVFVDFSRMKLLFDRDVSTPFRLSTEEALILVDKVVKTGRGLYVLREVVPLVRYCVVSAFGKTHEFVDYDPPPSEFMEKTYGPGQWVGKYWELHVQYWTNEGWASIALSDQFTVGSVRLRVGEVQKTFVVTKKTRRRTVNEWCQLDGSILQV